MIKNYILHRHAHIYVSEKVRRVLGLACRGLKNLSYKTTK